MKQGSFPILVVALWPLLLAGLVDLTASQSGEVPVYIASRFGPSSYAAWISSRSVVNSEGSLNPDTLPSGLRRSVQEQIENGDYEKQGCIQTLEVSVDQTGPIKARRTLADLIGNSIAIIHGTVTAIDYGFGSYGTPALLLKIQVDERIKGTDKIADSPYLYFEYPVASFQAGGTRFCKKDRRWPEPPEIGDRVMFFPYREPGDLAGRVIVPFPDGFEMIFERNREEALILPKALQNAPDLAGVKGLEAVRERVRRFIGKHLD